MNGAAIHLALNNFPPILNFAGFFLLIFGLSARNLAVTRTAFAVLLAAVLFGVPTYFSGPKAEQVVKGMQGINLPAIESHEEAANATFVLLVIEGILALIALLISPRRALTIILLVVALLSTFLLFYTARLGGHIHHPETQMRPHG